MPQKASAPRPRSWWIIDLFLKTLLPVALAAFAGYAETQAKKAEIFDLLDSYREYILLVEEEKAQCPCPQEGTE
jgi:hypothetical protein